MKILSNMDYKDLLVCSTISQRWNKLCNDDFLWRKFCFQDNVKCPTSLSTKKSIWKTMYLIEKTIECNWRSGSIWAPIVMKAHTKHVITCLEIYKEWIISGSDDSGICIWDINNGTCIVRLFGHLGGVWSLLVLPPLSKDKNRLDYYPLLVSGSTDRTARVWCLDNEKWFCTAVMFGHESTVRCMSSNSGTYSRNEGRIFDKEFEDSQFHENFTVNSKIHESCLLNHGHSCHSRDAKKFDDLMMNSTGENLNCRLICTGSRDASIRIWNAYTGECLNKLFGHRGAVRCVQFVGCHVVSGSYDCRIKIWCCRTGECLFTLYDHINRICTLWFDGTTIISGSFDTSMKIWKLEKINETYSQPDIPTSSEISTNQEQLVFSQSSSHTLSYGNLRVIRSTTFCGYLSLTSEMIIDNGQLITSNTDKTIRVWSLSNASCVQVLAGPNQHTSSVTSVQVTKDFIISSSNNGVVKLWCRHTGKYIRDILHLDSAFQGGLIWKILATKSSLVCAAGCPLGAEDTKIIIIHFDNGYEWEQLKRNQLTLGQLQRLHANSHREKNLIETSVRLSSLLSNYPKRPGVSKPLFLDMIKQKTISPSSRNEDETDCDEQDNEINWLCVNENKQATDNNNCIHPETSKTTTSTPPERPFPAGYNNDDLTSFLFESEDN